MAQELLRRLITWTIKGRVPFTVAGYADLHLAVGATCTLAVTLVPDL
jgi:hypothetical protein